MSALGQYSRHGGLISTRASWQSRLLWLLEAFGEPRNTSESALRIGTSKAGSPDDPTARECAPDDRLHEIRDHSKAPRCRFAHQGYDYGIAASSKIGYSNGFTRTGEHHASRS